MNNMSAALTKDKLLQLFNSMQAAYGSEQPQWWPADSPFEVAVGAVLTQNTAWANVEKAIDNLKAANALSLSAMLLLDSAELGELIRPSGYYNMKAKRLIHLCQYIERNGGMAQLANQTDLLALRKSLLTVNGVGPETADDILLYAFDKPVFVIDTYTRRLLQRHDLIAGKEDYDVLRLGFEQALGLDVSLFKQYHGLIVTHAKEACRKKPICGNCCMKAYCPSAKD